MMQSIDAIIILQENKIRDVHFQSPNSEKLTLTETPKNLVEFIAE